MITYLLDCLRRQLYLRKINKYVIGGKHRR